MSSEKPFYTSKEFWFFVILILQSVAALFGFLDWTPTQDQTEIMQLVVSVAGLILRLFFTESKLTLRKPGS